MKRQLLKSILLLCALIVGSSNVWAATYKLEQVTSVSAGGMYVFEQDGYVMNNNVSSSALQTTNSYKTTKLAGTETYVWTLVASNGYFKMKNLSYGGSGQCLTNSSSTTVTFGDGSEWAFNFQTDGTVIIQNHNNSDRFLGYTNSTSHAYKAYATSNLSGTSYPHAIKVYQLVEEAVAEGTTADPSITGAQYFVGSTTVTISNDESETGADIYYTLNGDDPTTTTSETCFEYATPFEITATATVKAIAKHADDTNASSVVSKTFTKITPKANIAALVAGAANDFVQLTDALVTYKNGNNAYLEDASGAIYLYGCASTLATGDKISGIMNVTDYTTYSGLPEIKAFELVDGYTKTTGNTVTPTEVTLATLMADDDTYNSYISRYVTIKGATVTSAFTSKNSTIEQGTNSIVLRDQNSSATLTSTVDNIVNVTGHVSINNTTKQIAVWEQSQIVVKVLADNTISGINDSYELDLVADDGISVLDLSGATATSGKTVQFSVTSATMEASKYDLDAAELTVMAKGTIVIKAYVDADDDYKYAEKTITITVKGAKDEPIFDVENQTLAFGETYTIEPTTNFLTDGSVTLSSSNALVASISGLTVTANAIGTATITVNAAEGTEYKAGSTTFVVTVTSPVASSSSPASSITTTFTDKDLNYNVGGIAWTATKDANSFESSGSNRGVQFGAGIGEFTLSTDQVSGTITKVSMVVSTNGTGNTIEVTVGDVDFECNDETTINLTSGDNKVTKEFVGSGSGNIVISVNDANKSVYFKSITVEKESTASVTIAASGYGTYCYQYPLTIPADNDDFKAYIVTAVDEEKVTFTKIDGDIKGGVPFILYGTPGTYNLSMPNESEEVPAGNMLTGTLASTYVTTVSGDYTNFGLSNGAFVKINDGVVPANKAYLPILTSNVPAGARLSIVFDDDMTTSISEMRKEGVEMNNVYNLNGQRVAQPTRGLYIVNGKKVIIK